jgi:energy-coupling factor transporter ATP-binding protein EcfA2
MFEEVQICPYTGLRAFTEEESLYFKGREEDIDQATEQLQRNKFLMLTGASGDGKSSLIYAGIIPNARAGFLKSKYTQWCVADFRPERTPFHNLCKAISRQLDIANPYTVQSELNHGFSAIIDLYKNSKRYIDTNSVAWQLADDASKAALKREAGNLIILVDQFEEFFTNPENYHKGVPSTDANLVLNLLLETARIALEEDLPIYVVFTMRSDYIGQCAAFRGLPEYIGFSQFFVPRLNRTQLQQVIEEPAILSGNRITRRLTERLIHDLTEGVDQLPILQHALNQVWHAADDGNEEMDLIHYAMVGGMPAQELPDEQVDRFNNWFVGLLPHIKACYHEPNLQNVLDTHTNKLYGQAAEYFTQKTGKAISEEDARAIVKTTFTCLTKIDQSRAVRNRMTLKEITNIIGRPEFGTKEVGAVLNIFREPGNTFIRPFILDETNSHMLDEADVLDITHESLIRNWQYLGQWAKEEFDNYSISLDFEQQLNRWVESDKSNGFLLSIGPLTYFENWFNTAKPNTHWIARYLPEETEQDKKLSNAKLVLGNAKEFLTQSAAKHVVTRTIMRYGPKRITAALGILAVIVLSSFAVRDYFQKQNGNVLKSIKEQTFKLANLPKLSPEFPIPVITEQLILGNLTIPEVIDAVKDPGQKIKIATGIATQLVTQGRDEPKKEILESLTIGDSLLEHIKIPINKKEISEGLKLIRDFSVTAGLAYFFNPDKKLDLIVKSNAKRSANWATHVFKTQPVDFDDIQDLSLALEEGINYKIFSLEEVDQLLKILSPFENVLSTTWLKKNYQRDKLLVRGSFNYGLRFNGLYQDLAYLYAAAGNSEMVLQCMDTLLQYQQNFYQNDYATHIENAANIAAVYYTYGTTSRLDQFVEGYCTRKKISTVEFYDRLVTRSVIDGYTNSNVNFYAGAGGQIFSNMNIKYSSDEMLSFFFTKLKAQILKINDNNERNFNLATAHKNEGNLFAYRKEIRGKENTVSDQYYKGALTYYQLLPKEYLNQSISVSGLAGSETLTVPRKFLLLYPDYRVPFHPFEPRTLVYYYNSFSFTEYVLNNNLFDALYETTEDLKFFEMWLTDYHMFMSTRDWTLHDAIPVDKLDRLALKLEERKASQSADLNILYLHLGEQTFGRSETEKGISYCKKIQPDKLLNAFQYKNYNWVNDYSFELVGKCIAFLSTSNQFDLAYILLNVFKKEVNRSSLYAYASQLVSLNKQSPEIAQRLLDSARIEMNRLDNLAVFQPNRHQVAMALMFQDPDKNSKEAYRIIKNSSTKFEAIWRFSKAYAMEGNLFKAQQQAPGLISPADNAGFLRTIAEGFSLAQPQKKEWKKFKDNELVFVREFLPYVNEN